MDRSFEIALAYVLHLTESYALPVPEMPRRSVESLVMLERNHPPFTDYGAVTKIPFWWIRRAAK